jgi:hypothetical protein
MSPTSGGSPFRAIRGSAHVRTPSARRGLDLSVSSAARRLILHPHIPLTPCQPPRPLLVARHPMCPFPAHRPGPRPLPLLALSGEDPGAVPFSQPRCSPQTSSALRAPAQIPYLRGGLAPVLRSESRRSHSPTTTSVAANVAANASPPSSSTCVSLFSISRNDRPARTNPDSTPSKRTITAAIRTPASGYHVTLSSEFSRT